MTPQRTSSPPTLLWGLGLAFFGLLGCSWDATEFITTTEKTVDNGFVSDDPLRTSNPSYGNSADASASGAAGSSNGGQDQGKGAAERAIEEADIVQLNGSLLYALSAYSGLSVIDVGKGSSLELKGSYQLKAQPFEMILRDTIVIAMFNAYPVWTYDKAKADWTYQQTSRVVAFDTSNPSQIKEVGSFDLPGEISDSRVVGNIFYVVSYENGSCWNCAQTPTTTVTSINVSNPKALFKADSIAFQEAQGSGGWTRRSVTVTPERMFVAGLNWDWNANTGHSTVQVVDIADPLGDIRLGASVPVKGQIESRWQMDEYQGVLRVISQPGTGWGNTFPPEVETFRVKSHNEITPLGSLTMKLPRPENLQSARFDGPRAFAVTFEQTDPLFTLDMSDPAQPKQVGELEIPGWLYHMVPQGDRLMALGYDNGNENGGITVSLFDIADLSKPTMLDRVNFGSEWGWLPEDQDRIHKAFKLFEPEGLAVVPFSGWSYGQSHCGTYRSGIQLVDFTRDSLTLRGVTPQVGSARRALLHNKNMIAVSEEGVNIFDISNRDKPVELASLATANNVVKSIVVGDHLVTLAGDWWTNRGELSVVALANPTSKIPLATLDLSALAQGTDSPCYSYSGFIYGSKLFAHNNYVYLVWDDSYWGYEGNNSAKTSLAVFDLTDPLRPTLVSRTNFDFRFDGWSWWDGYYGTEGALLNPGTQAIQQGSTLYLQEAASGYWDYQSNTWVDPVTASIHVIDLSDPKLPKQTATLDRSATQGQSPLQLVGSVLYASHHEVVAGSPGKVKFYVDRWNVQNPTAPHALPSINVPGSLLAVDDASHRLVTADYSKEVSKTSPEDCYKTWGYSNGWFDYDTQECVGFHRTLHLVQLNDTKAALMDTLPLADGSYGRPALGPDRVYFVQQNASYWDNSNSKEPNRLMTLSGFKSGKLRMSPSVDLADEYWTWNDIIAHGTKVIAISHYPGSLAVYDAADGLSAPKLAESYELLTSPSDVRVTNGKAYCALGQMGMQVLELP